MQSKKGRVKITFIGYLGIVLGVTYSQKKWGVILPFVIIEIKKVYPITL